MKFCWGFFFRWNSVGDFSLDEILLGIFSLDECWGFVSRAILLGIFSLDECWGFVSRAILLGIIL
jgi:hypothetical protein